MDTKFNTTLRDNYVLGSVYSLIINISIIITSYKTLNAARVIIARFTSGKRQINLI